MKKRLKAWGDDYMLPIVCCVIVNENGEVLFLKRHSEDLGGGKWGFPGGRIDDGERPAEAMVREIREETGIKLQKFTKIGEHEVRMPHGTVHMTTFRAFINQNEPIRLDPEEHQASQWMKPTAILDSPDLLYGVPSLLHDFDLLEELTVDPTLPPGSKVINLKEV